MVAFFQPSWDADRGLSCPSFRCLSYSLLILHFWHSDRKMRHPSQNNCLSNCHMKISSQINQKVVQLDNEHTNFSSPISDSELSLYLTSTVNTKVFIVDFGVLITANRTIGECPAFCHWFAIFPRTIHTA